MTIVLEPEIEKRLAEEARQRGTTPAEIVSALVRTHLPANGSEAATGPRNMAEFLAPWIGMLPPEDADDESDSTSAPRAHDEFTQILLAKEAQRRR